MEQMPLKDFVDHQRWLIDNGLFTDLAKDNLYLYGSLVHKDVQALHVIIDTNNSVIKYLLYVEPSLLKKISRFRRLSASTGLLDMWRLKRLLIKEGNLNFLPILNKFVKDFCGSKWKAELQIEDVAQYVDGLDELRPDESKESDKQPD